MYSFTLVIIADERGKGVKCQQELSIFGWVLTSSLLVGVGCAPFSPKGQGGEKPWSPTDYNTERQGQVWLTALPQNTTGFTWHQRAKFVLEFLAFPVWWCVATQHTISLLFCKQQVKALQHTGMVHWNDSDGGQWLGQIPKCVRSLNSGVHSQDNTMSVLCIYLREWNLVGMTDYEKEPLFLGRIGETLKGLQNSAVPERWDSHH